MLLVIKNLLANAGDIRDSGPIPGLGRSPGEGHGNPLQYSCLENPIDRGAWPATVPWITKNQIQLKWLSMHACLCLLFWLWNYIFLNVCSFLGSSMYVNVIVCVSACVYWQLHETRQMVAKRQRTERKLQESAGVQNRPWNLQKIDQCYNTAWNGGPSWLDGAAPGKLKYIYRSLGTLLICRFWLRGSELRPEIAFLTRFQAVLTLLVFPPFITSGGWDICSQLWLHIRLMGELKISSLVN